MRCCTALILFSIFISACKKDEAESQSEILTTDRWQITEHQVFYAGPGYPSRDEYALYPSCEKDNYYVFNKNGEGAINDGATKCYASNPQSIPFNWHFAEGATHLVISGTDWRILQLNTHTLKISTVRVLGGNGETKTFRKRL